MFFKESIIAKLWWFFKLEKRRYIVGILALSLVSVLNLLPPMVMGRVIDANRVFELDDLWTNTLGGLVALGAYRLLVKLIQTYFNE